MTDKFTKRVGPFAIRDFPPSSQAEGYATLIILHGFAWHSGVFMRMVPFAEQKNCRLVLVNRRDYPGSLPYTDDELEVLREANSPKATASESFSNLMAFTKSRAQELYDFLCSFIQDEKLAENSVILAGWSFGSNWIASLLAHASSLSTEALNLPLYIKRVTWYGSPAISLGYPPPPQSYNPLTHPSHAPGEGAEYFNTWVSGYYNHGESLDRIEQRIPLQNPPPTISAMTPDDIAAALHAAPASPGGSDNLFMLGGSRCSFWATLRKAALLISPLPSENPGFSEGVVQAWDNIRLHYIWCDQAAWESPWATLSLQAELEDAKKAGKEVREITMTRIRKANTFAHWDQPERALEAFFNTVPEI